MVQSVSPAADWRRVKITTLFCYVIRKHFQAAARRLSLFASKRFKENHKSSTWIMNTAGRPCLNEFKIPMYFWVSILGLNRTLSFFKYIHLKQLQPQLCCYKRTGNSFQYFPRLSVWWIIITSLYRLMPKSWYQQTAQSSGNELLLIVWLNRLP